MQILVGFFAEIIGIKDDFYCRARSAFATMYHFDSEEIFEAEVKMI